LLHHESILDRTDHYDVLLAASGQRPSAQRPDSRSARQQRVGLGTAFVGSEEVGLVDDTGSIDSIGTNSDVGGVRSGLLEAFISSGEHHVLIFELVALHHLFARHRNSSLM
jgi:hypothetical protein